MPSSLSDLTTVKRRQRLSITEIHELWNVELHRKAGRKRCQQDASVFRQGLESPSEQSLDALAEFRKIGKWKDASGCIFGDKPIEDDLIQLVRSGGLHAYTSLDPNEAPCPMKELQQVNLKTKGRRYFIDRDELGRLLVRHKKALPAFWYDARNQDTYHGQLTCENQRERGLQEQVDALRAENEELKRRLGEARAFMDPKHPFFAPELEACVAAWEACYNDKTLNSRAVAKKDTHGKWLKAHRRQVVFNEEDELIDRALQRMSMVANPNKKSGRPKG